MSKELKQKPEWKEKTYPWGKIYYFTKGKLSDGFWFVGSSKFDTRGLRHEKVLNRINDKDFYLKYWEFKKDKNSLHKPKKQKKSLEYNFILKGKIKGSVDKTKNIILETGDFIVIKPGFFINLQEKVLENTKGITIKSPGIIDDEEYKQ